MIEVCAFPNRFTDAQRVKVFIGSSDDETKLVGGSNLLQNKLLLTTKGKKMKTAITLLLIGSTISLTAPAIAATAEAQSTYDAAKNSAAADYKMAITRCDGMAGNLKDICVAEARAARIQVEANAKAAYKGTVSEHSHARKDIANANYDVEKAKCENQGGNQKDVCIKEAKANRTAAKADAIADKKVIDARTDAHDDKQTANYKVAVEKCDALSGAGKNTCIDSAKIKYGQ